MVHISYVLSFAVLWKSSATTLDVKPHDTMVAMSLTDSGLVRRESREKEQKWHQQWRVKCDSTQGAFQLQTSPESPQGVRRFLDLVRDGFFQDQERWQLRSSFCSETTKSDDTHFSDWIGRLVGGYLSWSVLRYLGRLLGDRSFVDRQSSMPFATPGCSLVSATWWHRRLHVSSQAVAR